MKIISKLCLLSICIVLSSSNQVYALLDTAINYEKNTIAVFSYGEAYANSSDVKIYFRCKSNECDSSKEAYDECTKKSKNLIEKVKVLELEISNIETSDINLIYKPKKAAAAFTIPGMGIPGMGKPTPSANNEGKNILCYASQDIRISMPFTKGDFISVISIEDLMINNKAEPIEPKEFGDKVYGFINKWCVEKNNLEYILDNKDKLKSEALENAILKGKKQALDIAKQINKNIVSVHSIQHVDEKDKIMHLWGSFHPASIDGGMIALDRIKYQVGILLIYTFE